MTRSGVQFPLAPQVRFRTFAERCERLENRLPTRGNVRRDASTFEVVAGHVAKVGDPDEGEILDFFQLFRRVEVAAESALGASLVNLLCLRNWAYRAEHPDPPFSNGRPNPHVHWHVAPRYADPVEIAGDTFVDEDFGLELTWRARSIEASVAGAIIDRVSASLGLNALET